MDRNHKKENKMKLCLNCWRPSFVGAVAAFLASNSLIQAQKELDWNTHSIKFLRGIEMKMMRLLWQEDPKGLTRTAIVRFLRHGPRIFYWICLDGKIVFVDGNNTWACYKHGGSHSFFSRRAVRKLFSLAVNLKFIYDSSKFRIRLKNMDRRWKSGRRRQRGW